MGKRARRPPPQARAPAPPQPVPAPEQEQEHDPVHDIYLDPACLAALAAALYVKSAYPTVSGGDAGELLTVSCTLGVAHPPGYPLWTWLAAGARVLGGWLAPHTRVAFRVHVMSSALDALAAALACLVARRLALLSGASRAGARAGALAAGGLFAFAPGIWLYAIQAEVFSLNCALVAGVMLALLRFHAAPSPRSAAVVALTSGLALSNQHTAVLFVVPYALWVVWRLWRRRELGARTLLLLSAAALLGLAPYLHLPVATALGRESSWGETRSLEGFWRHFFRQEYGTFRLASETAGEGGPELFFTRFAVFMRAYAFESLAVGAPLAAAGLWRVGRRSAVGAPLLSGLALYFAVMSWGANLALDDFHLGITLRMLQQPFMALFMFAGAGLAHAPLGRLPCMGVALALVAAQAARTWPLVAQHADNYAFEEYGRAVLEPLPEGALLLANEDLNVNTITYLQQCEGVRPDVHVIPLALITYRWWKQVQLQHHPGLHFPGTRHHPRDPDDPAAAFNMATFLAHNVDRPWQVYVAGGWKEGDGSEEIFERWPVGFADRVMPPGTESDLARYLSLATLPDSLPPQGALLEEWEHILAWKHVHVYTRASAFISERAGQLRGAAQQDALALCRRLYHRLLSSEQACDAVHVEANEIWRNAGVVCGQLSAMDDSPAVVQDMFGFWAEYVRRVGAEQGADIQLFIDKGVNPYTGKTYSAEEVGAWVDSWRSSSGSGVE